MLNRRVVTAGAAVLSPLVFALAVPVLDAHGGGTRGRLTAAAPAPLRLTRLAAPSPRGATLWVNTNNPAALAEPQLRAARPADAALLRKIAAKPQSTWLGEWLTPVAATSYVAQTTTAAAASGAIVTFVVYAIPGRDCGGYSRGGVGSPAAYRTWVDAVSRGLAGRQAIVVLEPDALSLLDCLSAADRITRLSLLSYAVDSLGRNPGVSIYLDAGHSRWKPAAVSAERLRAAGVDRARGFSLNVANFGTTTAEIAYGKQISAALGGAVPFVVDTSRNGLGPWTGEQSWCNPPGRSLGATPTTAHPDPLVDALLWVKTPGQSDGSCRGGPPAGVWWQAYALDLAANARS